MYISLMRWVKKKNITGELFYKFVEKPLEFVKPLKDIEVTEGQDIELECVLSKEGVKATWQKNNKALPVDNRVKVTSDKDTHKLTIRSALVEDKGEYKVKVADKTSTAKVFVEGRVTTQSAKPCSCFTSVIILLFHYLKKISIFSNCIFFPVVFRRGSRVCSQTR